MRRAFRKLCSRAADALLDTDDAELEVLYEIAIQLPKIDLTLQVRLPKVSSPDIELARTMVEEDDDEASDFAISRVAVRIDSPHRRLELARAIVALENAGEIDPKVAAVAVLELSEGDVSGVFVCSVAEAIRVSAGESRTPAGLVVAGI